MAREPQRARDGNRLLDGTGATAEDFILHPKGGEKFITFFFDHHLPEFQLLGVSYIAYRKWDHGYITVGISLRREHRYYFFKVTILMWLIVLCVECEAHRPAEVVRRKCDELAEAVRLCD